MMDVFTGPVLAFEPKMATTVMAIRMRTLQDLKCKRTHGLNWMLETAVKVQSAKPDWMVSKRGRRGSPKRLRRL